MGISEGEASVFHDDVLPAVIASCGYLQVSASHHEVGVHQGCVDPELMQGLISLGVAASLNALRVT